MERIIGHDSIVRFFTEALAQGNCTHAYLFSGPLSVGKTTLIRYLAQCMLCRERSGDDACDSCEAHTKGQHPDFSLFDPDEYIDPETEAHPKTIMIDCVREIERWASFAPIMSTMKIQAIAHADRFTDEAANALLKLLEDPPPNTIFFLTAEFPNRLPATLRSRMQQFRSPRASYDSIVSLLEARCLRADRKGAEKKQCEYYAALAHGCPGVAIRCMDDEGEKEHYARTIDQWLKLLRRPMDVFTLTERGSETIDFQSFFMTGQIFLHDLLRSQWGTGPRFRSLIPRGDRQELARRYPQKKLSAMSRSILHAMQLLRTNASSKLIVENFFVSL